MEDNIKYVCPHCNIAVDENDTLCHNCGESFEQASQRTLPEPLPEGWWKRALKKFGILCAVLFVIGLTSQILHQCVEKEKESQREQQREQYESEIAADNDDGEAKKLAEDPTADYDLNEDYAPDTEANLAEGGEFHLEGTVAGQGCKMDITIDPVNGTVYGTYSYNKYNKPIDLEGTIDGNNVRLGQVNEYGEVTSLLEGYVSGNTFTGTHTRYETMKETPFSFTAQ